MTRVVQVSKEELDPMFGYAMPSEGVAYVRKDLPGCVKNFVIVHELYHLRDRARWWVLREIKANAVGAIRHPIGFTACVLISLTPQRLGYYWRRMRRESSW